MQQSTAPTPMEVSGTDHPEWSRIVLHADMDAFYAAVEQRDNPELVGKPVLIGPNSYRGVVLTASYEARPYGVGSAMPVGEARRRCPDAIMVEPRFDRYQEVSGQVMDIFADFSPRVEAISLDEAFLDMTGATKIFGSPREMAAELKRRVLATTGLHISVGVAASKYVAKVASAYDKPNGLTVVPPDETVAWLAPQPISRLWGVGRKTAPKLQAMGLLTIGDVAAADPRKLEELLGQSGRHYYALSHGEDPRPVLRGRAAKSIGSDRTLSKDVSKREDIERHLRRSADRIARRVRAKDYVAKGIRVKLKTTEFQLLTRQRMVNRPIDSAEEFFRIGQELLGDFDHRGPFRLVGMAAFDLRWRCEPLQMDLFDDGLERSLETTIDKLIDRFGAEVFVRARDLNRRETVHKNGVNLDFLDYRDGERVATPAAPT